MGRDDEVIRPQLVLFLPAKYRMRRGTAEYELDFNLNGRTYSETQLGVSRTRELSIGKEIRFRELLTDSRPQWPHLVHHLSERADHVILIKWHARQAWKEPSGRRSCY